MKNSVMWVRLMWIAGVVSLGLGTAGAVAATANSGSAADKKDVAALYLKNCSICHGDEGDANTRAQSGMYPVPRDFTTAEAAIELTRERMIKSVTDGRPGTTMVAHKKRLSEQEIADLVDYIRSNFMQLPGAAAGTPAAVSLGEKVYTENCSVCHGDNGNSAIWAQNGLNPAPRDFTSPEAQNELTRDRMLRSVTNGRPGTGMVSYKKRLSKDEIAAVVGFIRFKFMGVDPDKDTGAAPLAMSEPEARTPPPSRAGGIPGVDAPLAAARAAPARVDPHQQPHDGTSMPAVAPATPTAGHSVDVDMSLPVPQGLKGDLVWGRQFYMANCFDCHGVTGEGDGPRAYFNIPPPRDFTSEASRQVFNRPRIFSGITNGKAGTVMPAWGKVLTEQEIAGLTEFVFQTFIQPAETDNSAGKKKAP
ncbi:MAG: c-type cytochrome [Gammaproteobacteria bacterium]|nr:c-type cytochrome [Gammaproteobacteria bacterium]